MVSILTHMPRSKKEPTETVRIAVALAKDLRIIAANEDKSVPDLLAEILRPEIVVRKRKLRESLVSEDAGDDKSAKSKQSK